AAQHVHQTCNELPTRKDAREGDQEEQGREQCEKEIVGELGSEPQAFVGLSLLHGTPEQLAPAERGVEICQHAPFVASTPPTTCAPSSPRGPNPPMGSSFHRSSASNRQEAVRLEADTTGITTSPNLTPALPAPRRIVGH